MVYKCANCGGVLEYDVEHNCMSCSYCGSSYSVEEITHPVKEEQTGTAHMRPSSVIKDSGDFFAQTDAFKPKDYGDYNTLLEKRAQEAELAKERYENRKQASIQMQIMRCTSCGAELAVNSVEASTFCAYCGQATVVQDRVGEYLKPDYIIPFHVSRDDAVRIIRAQLSKGFFVPKGIKEFEVEKIRGIYVPFWLFDMYYHDRQFYKYSKKQGKSSVTRYELFEGETNFRRLTLDASKNLNDDSSARLEPYDMRQLKEFDMAYMSGYYSDRFDMGIQAMTGPAVQKAKFMYDGEVAKELRHAGTLVQSNPDYQISKTEYALLPAWFLTFRYNNKPFTILVNGQTGKMVGAVPFVKAKVIGVFSLFSVVIGLMSVLIITALSHLFFVQFGFDNKMTWIFLIGVPVVTFMVAYGAYKKYLAMAKSMELTNAKQINRFAKERTDR